MLSRPTEIDYRQNKIFGMAIILCGSFIFGALIVYQNYLAVAISFIFLVVLFCLKSPIRSLYIFILVTPYAAMPLFNQKVFSIAGIKPYLALGLFVLVMCLFVSDRVLKMPLYAKVFLICMFALLTVSTLRAMPYLPRFSLFWEKQYTPFWFLANHYFRAMLYFIPFIIISKAVFNLEEFERLINVICVSICAFSIFLLIIYIYFCPDRGDVDVTRNLFESVTNIHANGIASNFVIALPILIAKGIKRKDIIGKITVLLSITMISILYSRAAYVLTIFTFIVFFVITKRFKWLPFASMFLVLIILIMPSTIKERAIYGIYTKDINVISSSRIEEIWKPIIHEYLNSPSKLIFGNGRYALLTSDVNSKSHILDVHLAHNIYLDQFFDSGIIGLLVFIGAYLLLIAMLIKTSRKKEIPYRDYLLAIFISLFNYLIGGMVGRHSYPALENSLLWVVLGLAVAIIRLSSETAKHKEVYDITQRTVS